MHLNLLIKVIKINEAQPYTIDKDKDKNKNP
jgi:hypothetical protein